VLPTSCSACHCDSSLLQSYSPLALLPKHAGQALWQGGVLVFSGERLVWAHADPAASAHADLQAVVAAATKGEQKASD